MSQVRAKFLLPGDQLRTGTVARLPVLWPGDAHVWYDRVAVLVTRNTGQVVQERIPADAWVELVGTREKNFVQGC